MAQSMPDFRRFLSRRWLLAILAVSALLFSLAMLHPYPRQSLFGPTIRGKPWCVWEDAVRHYAHREEYEKTMAAKMMRWLRVNQEDLDDHEIFKQSLNHAEMLPLFLALAEDRDRKVRQCVLFALN